MFNKFAYSINQNQVCASGYVDWNFKKKNKYKKCCRSKKLQQKQQYGYRNDAKTAEILNN